MISLQGLFNYMLCLFGQIRVETISTELRIRRKDVVIVALKDIRKRYRFIIR